MIIDFLLTKKSYKLDKNEVINKNEGETSIIY